MRVLVILNAAAGTLLNAAGVDHANVIRARFAKHGVEADVRDVAGNDLHAATLEARDGGEYDLIVGGGGDGTLNTIAGALVGGRVPFAVLPLGTFNHLAKELGTPLEIGDAIDALCAGEDVPFNVGQVNDKTFLLFVAIGFYSDMIRHRDAQRKALGRRKMWAGAIAFCRTLFRWPLMKVTLRDVEPPVDRESVTRRTTLVSVSVSGYQLRQMGLTDVANDARETLSVLVSPHVSRLGLVTLAMKRVFRRKQLASELELLRVKSVVIDPHHRSHVRVGFDGEVETMSTPLKIRLVECGLTMRMPKAPGSKRG